MSIHRFLTDMALVPGDSVIEDRGIVHQIKRVLRIRAGEKIILWNRLGEEADAEIIMAQKDSVSVRISSVRRNEREPRVSIVVYCSIPKRDRFEWLVEKATEVGATEIAPIIAERTVKEGIKRDRIEKIMKEAAEQSGRGMVPVLREISEFEKASADAGVNDITVFCDTSGEEFGMKLRSEIKTARRVGIFVGPEGGWSESELRTARAKKFHIASLGKLTLRVETAAIAAIVLTRADELHG